MLYTNSSKASYYSHFTDVENIAQRGKAVAHITGRIIVGEMDLNPVCPTTKMTIK